MFEYIKTKTYDSLTVSSIVTVMHMNLRNTEIAGEAHNFPEIIYIADGYNDLPLDGKILCLKSGQLVIVAPNTFHGASAG